MQCIYTCGTNCASVTYGNIAQHIKEYIKTVFPKNFFNYEHISSELAYRNIRRQLGPNTRKYLEKRSKPYLIIRPVITVPDEMYLFETPLTSNIDHLETSVDKRNLFPIIQDRRDGLDLLYRLNRDKIEFQITVVVSTLFQQIDLYKGLINTIYWNRPFTKRCPLEFMIPRDIMSAFAIIHHIDLSKTNQTGIFLDYLNTYSSYPITYKTRTSTSRDEYFMYSNQEVLISFSDLQISEGTKKNMADDEFQLSFNVTAEFNLPGMFFLMGDDRKRDDIMGSIIHGDGIVNDISFPLFTIENLFGNITEINGFRKYRSSILQMEKNCDGNDITEFGSLLNNEIKSVLRYYQQYHTKIGTIAYAALYKNATQLVEGKDYIVDWGELTITTFNPSMEDSYRLILYLNMIKIDELIVAITDSSQTDRPALKPKE